MSKQGPNAGFFERVAGHIENPSKQHSKMQNDEVQQLIDEMYIRAARKNGSNPSSPVLKTNYDSGNGYAYKASIPDNTSTLSLNGNMIMYGLLGISTIGILYYIFSNSDTSDVIQIKAV